MCNLTVPAMVSRELLLSYEFPAQIALLLALALLSIRVGPRLLQKWNKTAADSSSGLLLWRKRNGVILLLFVLLALIGAGGWLADLSLVFINMALGLSGLWLLVALLYAYAPERPALRLIGGVIYAVLAFHLAGWWGPMVAFLDRVRLRVGSLDLSIYGFLSGLFVLVFLLWLVQITTEFLEKRIKTVRGLSPSLQVLASKVVKITLVAIAVLIAVDSMGLDLTVLTVFGGAFGLGLGFGLQKVVSNFVSGVILLLDRSIKPGDVIEIDDTYGWINNLRARYVSIITRDGTEHLIPNEDLITQRVVNWSFTDELVRLRVPIGVSYNSDIHRVIDRVVEAAKSVERILDDPSPRCLLKGFGDSSVDLELMFWISDPSNGVSNVKSEALLQVWDAFKEHGIEIPFPQRDVHFRPPAGVEVTLRPKQTEGGQGG